MSNIAFYRRNADQAFLLARNATSESDRAKYSMIAQGWIDRIAEEESLPFRADAPPQTTQPSMQQQQQPQPKPSED